MNKATRIALAILALAATFGSPARADDETSETLSDLKCSTMLEHEKKNPAAVSTFVSMFAGGVVTGFNIEMQIRDKHFIDLHAFDSGDPSAIWATIKPYCVAHPDRWISTGALELLKPGKTYRIAD